jgi:hypothetical protein
MSGWIGVDFDGTLVEWTEWQGSGIYGPPIRAMVDRVRKWLALGQDVRIVTARANDREDARGVENWCLEHFGMVLGVTSRKDYQMIELWDDRAVQVVPNEGVSVEGVLQARIDAAHEEHGRLAEAVNEYLEVVGYDPSWGHDSPTIIRKMTEEARKRAADN